MKSIKNFSKLSLAVAALFLASCNKDDGPAAVVTPPAATNNSYVTGKVDGADFSSFIFGTPTAVVTRAGSGDSTLIMMTGSDPGFNAISINLLGNIAVGEYSINSSSDGNVLAYIPNGGVSYDTSNCSGASGILTVTAYDDTKIEGTFSFIGKDDENCEQAKTITEGSFKGVFMN